MLARRLKILFTFKYRYFHLNFWGLLMNQGELVDELAEVTELTKADVKRVLDAQADVITKYLAKAREGDDGISLPGLGKFKAKKRAARTGRNPQTGEELKIPARKVPTFSASKGLKDAVAKKKK